MSDGGTSDTEVEHDGGPRRSRATVDNLLDSLEKTAKAEEEHDTCPECGEEYIDTDTTLSGDLVFIHDENPLEMCTAGGGDSGE